MLKGNVKVISRVKKPFSVQDTNPYWVAGFTSGDGSFNIKISNSSTNKTPKIGDFWGSGSRVQLRFAIGLNIREKELISGLAKYFNFHNEVDSNKYIYVSEGEGGQQLVAAHPRLQ